MPLKAAIGRVSAQKGVVDGRKGGWGAATPTSHHLPSATTTPNPSRTLCRSLGLANSQKPTRKMKHPQESGDFQPDF